jgi:HEAT repeat protein
LLNTLPKDLKLRVIDAMIARLQDKISEIFWVKWDVERAITSFGTLALPPLRIAAEDDNPNVRDAAQSVMQDIRDAERFKLSLRALRDEQWEVRHAAARRFGRLGDRRAIESLQHALSDENPLVREAVANALQQLNAPVNSEPTRTSEDITFGIDESLRPIKVAADHADTDTLLQMLEHFDFATRQAAEEALMSLNEPDIDRLSQALDDGDPQIRQVVVWALGSYEDPHVIEPLKDGLKDEHPMVRWSAAYALGQFGELAVAPLIQALEDETAISWVIATELGRLGDPLAVEPLLEALTDSNDELRQAAAEALAMLAPKIESLQLLRKVARALWWQLTDIQSVASAAWKALAVVVATRTERDITERNEADSQPFTLTNSA